MLSISQEDIRRRIQRDNPWWAHRQTVIPESVAPRRIYFAPFKSLALNFKVRRAAVLLGPRRVGKTFMIKQLIHEAIQDGINPCAIMYASIDTPIYSNISLQKFLDLMPKSAGPKLVIFDEIQYLRNWEVHLKDLVDHFPEIKFIASGSAAAALRLKSNESGAGRFSEFMLPPLTFFEFLNFLEEDKELIEQKVGPQGFHEATDIELLNRRFIDYLNYGGYPEAVFNAQIRNNPEQFIRNDIIDKVLLKDLPSLYGIHEIQDLNRLFSFLAYNAGNEASLENISQASGISKPTIKRYIEYLESAFLIIKLPTVDDNCRTIKRERNFKIYLNNPSMRAAIFAPVSSKDTDQIGHLAESAVFSQWQHAAGFRRLRYSRWRNEGEVDVVMLSEGKQKPVWVGEVKWSDRIEKHRAEEVGPMMTLIRKHRTITEAFYTTRTYQTLFYFEGKEVFVIPTALYCYTVGKNITADLTRLAAPKISTATEVLDEEQASLL